jgi:hypothetical protein
MVRIAKTSGGSRYILSLIDREGTLLDDYQPSGKAN